MRVYNRPSVPITLSGTWDHILSNMDFSKFKDLDLNFNLLTPNLDIGLDMESDKCEEMIHFDRKVK